MHQDSELIWAEIKNYEQRLENNPESYLFARLSQVYLKVQLVDDALHVARQGTTKYPSYVAGQRALAMACNAKGLNEECLQALQKVASASPDDLEVQKLLGKLSAESGNKEAAQKAFNTILEFQPDDEDCQAELNKLLLSAVPDRTYLSNEVDFGFGAFVEESEDEIIELSEADIFDEPGLEATFMSAPTADLKEHDPLTTATLAELYVKQGFEEKAIGIYRSILAENPFNSSVRTRIEELEAKFELSTTQSKDSTETVSPFKSMEKHMPEFPASLQGVAAVAIDTFEEWLDNIRRIKACR